MTCWMYLDENTMIDNSENVNKKNEIFNQYNYHTFTAFNNSFDGKNLKAYPPLLNFRGEPQRINHPINKVSSNVSINYDDINSKINSLNDILERVYNIYNGMLYKNRRNTVIEFSNQNHKKKSKFCSCFYKKKDDDFVNLYDPRFLSEFQEPFVPNYKSKNPQLYNAYNLELSTDNNNPFSKFNEISQDSGDIVLSNPALQTTHLVLSICLQNINSISGKIKLTDNGNLNHRVTSGFVEPLLNLGFSDDNEDFDNKELFFLRKTLVDCLMRTEALCEGEITEGVLELSSENEYLGQQLINEINEINFISKECLDKMEELTKVENKFGPDSYILPSIRSSTAPSIQPSQTSMFVNSVVISDMIEKKSENFDIADGQNIKIRNHENTLITLNIDIDNRTPICEFFEEYGEFSPKPALASGSSFLTMSSYPGSMSDATYKNKEKQKDVPCADNCCKTCTKPCLYCKGKENNDLKKEDHEKLIYFCNIKKTDSLSDYYSNEESKSTKTGWHKYNNKLISLVPSLSKIKNTRPFAYLKQLTDKFKSSRSNSPGTTTSNDTITTNTNKRKTEINTILERKSIHNQDSFFLSQVPLSTQMSTEVITSNLRKKHKHKKSNTNWILIRINYYDDLSKEIIIVEEDDFPEGFVLKPDKN